jgi:DNA repair exonuclease SbcCD nuclease subunit
MKIIFIGDLHLGARSGSSHFCKYFNKFFSDVLYPYMIEHGIKDIVQLGDFFDSRTNLSLKAFHYCKPEWLDPLIANGIHMHVLIGNHDITLRESLEINSPSSLLQEYVKSGNLTIHDKPTQIQYDNCSIDVIPWICKENEDEVMRFINRPKVSDLCVGHFEISGFQMYRGVDSHGGMSPETFQRYERTLSGHYHTRSFSEVYNIEYIGTPYEITWSDCNDPRGFTVFDTETRRFEFIQNPNVMFRKLYYNDGCGVDLKKLDGKFVKLIVEKKSSLYQFDNFLTNLRTIEFYDLSIVENTDTENLMNGEVDENIEVEDTLSIISSYVDKLETTVDKNKIKSYLQSLYNESLTV